MTGIRALMQGWRLSHDGNAASEENIRSSNNAAKTISTEHERIHAGKMFHYSDVSTIAAGATLNTLFSVGSASTMHVRAISFIIDVGQCEGYLYEAPFIDVNSLGNGFSVINLNRESAYTVTASFYHNPFIDANSMGLKLDSGAIVQTTGGLVKTIEGVSQSAITEWNFKKNTNYLFSFVNNAGTTGFYNSNVSFYEPHD